MKKLVKLDKHLRLTEIDLKATRRQAEIVLQYIANAPETERQKYKYVERVIPLVNAFLDGSLEIPWFPNSETATFREPYDIRGVMEGWAPNFVEDFARCFFKFELMIGAESAEFGLSTHESGEYIFGKYRVEKDGELYEWCWFDD